MPTGLDQLKVAWLLTAMLALAGSLAGQAPGSGSPATLNTDLIRILGPTNAFSAKAEVRVLDRASSKESISMTMNFAQLYTRIRAEMDMAKVKSKEIGSNDVATLRQLGLDQLVTVIRLDRMTALYAYPTLRGYVELPLTAEESTDPRLAAAGSETVDGHPCTKFRVTRPGEKGKDKLEAYVWKARDLRNTPVRVQIYQPDAVVVIQFKDIRRSRPQYSLFEPPTSYTRYDSMEALTLSRMVDDK